MTISVVSFHYQKQNNGFFQARSSLLATLRRLKRGTREETVQSYSSTVNDERELNIQMNINGVPVPTGTYPWFAKSMDGNK